MALAVAPRSAQSSAGQVVSFRNDYDSAAQPAPSYGSPYASYASSSSSAHYNMPREPIQKAHHAQHPGPYPMSYPPSNQTMPPPPMHHLPPAQQQQQQMNNGYGQQQNGNGQNGTAAHAGDVDHSVHASPLASPAVQTQPLARADSGAASSPESMSPQSPQASNQQQITGTPASAGGGAGAGSSKKKHICPTCDRAFTTSGHLARHTRVHTGERNHKCPFPGCETRCSRQDNLQQHYRIHLSPGSRRSNSSATRAAIQRAMSGPSNPPSLASAAAALVSQPPPPNAPPPLAHAHGANAPPPLAHAYPPSSDGRGASADRSPDLRYPSYAPPQSSAYAPPPPAHAHSPGHSASASPVMGHGHGQQHLYAHHGAPQQTAYTFAPQPQVPILQGPAANTTVYASPYGSQPQPTASSVQYQQPYPPQQQQQPPNLQRSNSTSSHRGQGPSHSGSPSPTHSPHQSTQGIIDPAVSGNNGSSTNSSNNNNPYPNMGPPPPSNGHQNQQNASSGNGNGGGSGSSTPGQGGHGMHHHQYSNGPPASYAFQMPPQQQGRYGNASPPPILAPIRKDSGGQQVGAPGNPYPQVAKGYAS